MRRAAVQAFHTAHRAPFRRLLWHPSLPQNFSSHVLGLRPASSSRHEPGTITPLHSGMYFRNFSVALISTLGGIGAWYAYQGESPISRGTFGPGASPVNGGSIQQSRGLTSASVYSNAPNSGSTGVSAAEVTESTRRAVVVDDEGFYSGSIVGEGPLQKTTDDAGRKVLEMLTPDQATEKLRRNEESYIVGRGQGVVRYDVVQSPSNDPIEDDHSEKIVPVPNASALSGESGDWMFWGVYDGHSGWTTSAKLRQVLINFVARELNTTYNSAPKSTLPSPESIDSAIKKGFLRLDHEIVHESVDKVLKANSKRVAAELLAPALSGSCALLSFYDSRSKLLRVACTGDSRAVLGRRGPSGKWIATALSTDQTGGNEDEAARIRKEHPGEKDVVMNGRVWGGLEPSRAFGDSFYKWTTDTQEKIKMSFFGRTPSNRCKTPPYVTAEPVVTTTKVEPERGDFVVMATDGLWEMLTNEEVVGLVGLWLDTQASNNPKNNSTSRSSSWLTSLFGGPSQGNLPVEKAPTDSDTVGQRAPVRQRQWGVNANERQRFVVEDKNAATHLVRNALGGADRDMVCALLTLPSPYSRRYRDDLTVEVIFFGEGGEGGEVALNKEATAPRKDELRAKL